MADPSPPASRPAIAEPIVRSFSRFYFGTAVAIAIACAVALPFMSGLSTQTMAALLAGYVVYGAGAAWAFWGSERPQFPRDAAMFVGAIGALVLIAGAALAWGDGVRSSALSFCGILVCVLGVVTQRRYSLALGALAGALVTGLAALEWAGVLPRTLGGEPLATVLVYQWLALACGMAGGVLIAGIVAHSLRLAAERAERFRGLLGMAADWYWEQDAEHRFTLLSRDPGGSGAARRDDERVQAMLGRRLWEISEFEISTAQLDGYRADVEARRPFRSVQVRRVGRRGGVHHFEVSGAPRFDAAGQFSGYWGVSRDISAELDAQQAAAASEGRYRELFALSPSPMLLHRRGIVLDANAAAAALIGVESPAALRGFELATIFPEGAVRERVLGRIRQLEQMPVGQNLPSADYQVETVDGRRLHTQATGVRVHTPGGTASLSIFADITARVLAESALRRSETLLSLVFATSPDLITLTDVTTGRYLFVNEAFARLTGHAVADVIGRTSLEIGIWHDLAERDRLLATIRDHQSARELPVTFRHKSGSLVSMLVSAALFDHDGRAHLVINARDVSRSDRARMENEAMLRNASIGIAFTRDQRFVRVNPHFERMLGWPEGGMAGLSGGIVWPDEAAYAEVGRTIGPLLASGQPIEIERPIRRRDGSSFLARILAQAVDPKDPARSGTIWLCEDVTERRQIEQALAAARDAAEAASKAKSAFLANTSHEIRTPLNALLGLSRLARAPDVQEERRGQYLDQIHASAKQLAGIISDILDLSKIEAGKIVIEARPVDLRAMLEALIRNAAPIAEAKQLALELRVDDALPAHLIGDELRLSQIVSNYVANAIKFTERGRVLVEATRTADGAVRLTVHDTGPGIDEATQRRLFRPFTQADESTTRRYGGTGLGLSICRELAALMGGEVGLASRPGAGSSFWVELPLPETDARPDWAHTADADPELLRGAHVLLVEDNPVNMMIAAAMLEQWGIDVTQASDGATAISAVEHAAARGRPFDAVLMDVQMPGMSGHEAARALRLRWSARVLPIIALTAAALVSERDEAIAAGMDDFLTKPIDPAKLRDALMRQVLAVAP